MKTKHKVNRLLSCLLVLLMIVSLVPVMSVSAEITIVDKNDFNYEMTEDGVTITGLKEDHFVDYINVIVPDEIMGAPVTCIGSHAFIWEGSLQSIVLPKSLKTIEEYAFGECLSLTEIEIPDGTLSIGAEAFMGCYNINSISIPDSVMDIKYSAFNDTAYYCNMDNWEDGVLYINNALMEADKNLSGTYNIREGTTLIAQNAFCDCIYLENITIPNSVKSICECAFSGCESLKNVTLPNGITSIGRGSFSYTGIENITIPDGVTTIDEDVFGYCEDLNLLQSLSVLKA